MPHICHITTAHPPSDTRIFRRECVSLARSGYEVTLIARQEAESIENRVRRVPLPRSRGGRLGRWLWTTRAAAKLALSLKADLYHFHDPELLPAMRWLARRTTAPVVWDVHEYYYESIAYNNSLRLRPLSRLAAHLFGRLELHSCRHYFRGVVAISDSMAERYRHPGIITRVVGNFPDLDQLPQPDWRQRPLTPLLVSSGAQYGPKGAYQIADAFVLLRKRLDCDLAFWGTFHPAHLADELRLRTRATRSGERSAIVEGPVPWHVLMREYLPTAWIGFVLFDLANPNYRRGLPNRLFEMWAAGVPVVATAGTEAARLVTEYHAGIAVPDNQPQTLADAVERLLRHPDNILEMGLNARKAVETHFNWSRSFTNLLDLYAQLGVPASSV